MTIKKLPMPLTISVFRKYFTQQYLNSHFLKEEKALFVEICKLLTKSH